MAEPRFQVIPGYRVKGRATPTGLAWRLLGANNRELGRAAQVCRDVDEVMEQIVRVRAEAPGSQATIAHDSDTGLWTWQVSYGGKPIARSGRGFHHQRECRNNVDQFRAVAPTAGAASTKVPREFSWQRTVPVHLQEEIS